GVDAGRDLQLAAFEDLDPRALDRQVVFGPEVLGALGMGQALLELEALEGGDELAGVVLALPPGRLDDLLDAPQRLPRGPVVGADQRLAGGGFGAELVDAGDLAELAVPLGVDGRRELRVAGDGVDPVAVGDGAEVLAGEDVVGTD